MIILVRSIDIEFTEYGGYIESRKVLISLRVSWSPCGLAVRTVRAVYSSQYRVRVQQATLGSSVAQSVVREFPVNTEHL